MLAPHILTRIQGAWDVAKPFQIEDAQFAARNNSVVLGHETGLGKTFIAQLAWSQWQNANKALICGTLGSLAVWSVLLRKWGGIQPVFMQGMSDPAWKQALAVKEGVFMCTYNTFLYLMRTVERGKPHFDVLIHDELHRVMRKRNQMWKASKRLDINHYLGLSATWASRGPQDLFPVLNLVNHKTFSSYWRFVNTWCYIEDTSWGKEIFGVKNEDNLRRLLWSRYFVARTWKEVGYQFRTDPNNKNDSEPAIRRPELVPMGVQQTQLIRDLDINMMVTLGNEMVVTPNSLALLTRKLQMAISPKILMPSAEYGGPINYLQSKVAEDPHTVIFCMFREGLEVVRQALIDDGYPANKIFMLMGGTQPDDTNRIIDLWKKVQGVMLITIAFAQSFAVDTTSNAYMLGFDWDPNNNKQAEGRLRRLDSILQTPCNVTYIIPEGSDYHQVEYVVDGKLADTRSYLEGYAKNRAILINSDVIPLAQDPAEPNTGEDDDDE